jgi:hypothetical protein
MLKVQGLGFSRIKRIIFELKKDCKINNEKSRGTFAKIYKPRIFQIFWNYFSNGKNME